MWRSRLDNTDTTWCAGAKDKNQWIRWDFGSSKQVRKIQTKGRAQGAPQWVTKYMLEYTEDGESWVSVGTMFIGNHDKDSLQENILIPPIKAAIGLRLCPMEWHSGIAIRAEVIGCDAEKESTSCGTEVDGAVGKLQRAKLHVPPSGIVPFRGYSWYACPFACLADRLETGYPLFRAFYCRYLCRLHTISCQPATLIPLCALFESLIFTSVPHVVYHLVQLGPDTAPLRFAFPWIVYSFIGCLRAEQVLILWDRIVGFNSTELIAVLAAAIFVFRSRLLLNAHTAQDVETVFSDISHLQTIPLLQGFLFASDLGDAPFSS